MGDKQERSCFGAFGFSIERQLSNLYRHSIDYLDNTLVLKFMIANLEETEDVRSMMAYPSISYHY